VLLTDVENKPTLKQAAQSSPIFSFPPKPSPKNGLEKAMKIGFTQQRRVQNTKANQYNRTHYQQATRS
jgi:hypothetical protein